MILSPFTLVHGIPDLSATRKSLPDCMPGLDQTVVDHFQRLPQKLQQSLSDSLTNLATTDEMTQDAFLRVMRELTRSDRVITVGFWDVGARVGHLPRLIDRMNAPQLDFAFFEVDAAIPSGLVSRPARVAQWAKARNQRTEIPIELADFKNNVIDDDFFDRAERIREDLGIDYIVGIVPSMVAGVDVEDGEEVVFWNHFASIDRHAVLMSTFDLPEFAGKAGRPFEVGVALVALSALLVALNPGVDYHDDTGCLFDRNSDRVSLVEDIRNPMIEDRCLALMKEEYRQSVQALVQVLVEYSENPVDEADSRYLSQVQTRWLVEQPPKPDVRVDPVPTEEEKQILLRLLNTPEFESQPHLARLAVDVVRDVRRRSSTADSEEGRGELEVEASE